MKLKKWIGKKKVYKLKKQGGRIMATQIMATPVLSGREAQEVLKEIKILPSEKSKKNAKKLLQYFNNFISKDE